MQIYFVHRRKLTYYVIILYLHFFLKTTNVFFVYVVSFLMLLLDEYFLEPFDQVGILFRTCDLIFGQRSKSL